MKCYESSLHWMNSCFQVRLPRQAQERILSESLYLDMSRAPRFVGVG